MYLKLSIGKVRLGVSHMRFYLPIDPLTSRRGTKAWLVLPRCRKAIEADSICHPSDNFCKRTGRKRAANGLLETIRNTPKLAARLNKHDRHLIFAAICPEFAGSAPTRSRKRSKRFADYAAA